MFPFLIWSHVLNDGFDYASWESRGTSFNIAGVCSACRWVEFVVMHRSQYTQLPRYYNSLNSTYKANHQILHTYTQYHTHWRWRAIWVQSTFVLSFGRTLSLWSKVLTSKRWQSSFLLSKRLAFFSNNHVIHFLPVVWWVISLISCSLTLMSSLNLFGSVYSIEE